MINVDLRKKPEFWIALILVSTTFMYLIRILLELSINSVVLNGFYYLFFFGRKIAPVGLFALYLVVVRLGLFKKVGSWFCGFCLASGLVSFGVLGALANEGVMFTQLFSFRWWSYLALFSWIPAVMVGFVLFFRKTESVVASFVASWLCMTVAGVVYELPLYPSMRIDHFHLSHPLFVASSYVAFVFLAVMLYWHGWKPTRLFVVLLLCYFPFSLAYFSVRVGVYASVLGLFARVPSILLMLSVPGGLKE